MGFVERLDFPIGGHAKWKEEGENVQSVEQKERSAPDSKSREKALSQESRRKTFLGERR
jgi:hypothetical protein